MLKPPSIGFFICAFLFSYIFAYRYYYQKVKKIKSDRSLKIIRLLTKDFILPSEQISKDKKKS